MKNLTSELQSVYAEHNITKKRELAAKLIEASHAKSTTKKLALFNISNNMSAKRIDKYMTDYVFSGEGMKV